MITKITDNTKYQDLFKRAWDELRARNEFSQEELQYYDGLNNTFTCLEDYFTRLGTLMNPAATYYPKKLRDKDTNENSIDNTKIYANQNDANVDIITNYEYIILPLNEEYLAIDANTRDIFIPASFKKLVGVEGDHAAETLIFSIDRFYDYKDLLPNGDSTGVQIYIEWTDHEGASRATAVNMIHYDATTGKILFGWPLSSQVTKKAGTINFAVRFFSVGAAGADGKKPIQYSFGTKTHSLIIAPALRADLNSTVSLDPISNSFVSNIKDSPSSTAPPAAVPSFDNPGMDIDDTIADIPDTEYKIKVQAVAADTGYLQYKGWTRIKPGEVAGVELTGQEEYLTTEDTSRIESKVYYTSPSAGVYEVYSESLEAAKAAGTQVYERFYTYTFPALEATGGNDILGTYKASVVNRTGRNISAEKFTKGLTLVGPKVTFDLNETLPSNCHTSEILSASVKDYEDSEVKYIWSYSHISEDAVSEDASLGSAATPSELKPGWYSVVAKATRNRSTIEAPTSSGICRVIGDPAPITNVSFDAASQEEEIDIGASANHTFTVLVTIEDGGKVDALCSDGIEYKWYGCCADDSEEYQLITEDKRAKYRVTSGSSLNSASLTVYGADNAASAINTKPIGYKCYVRNSLGNNYTSPIETTVRIVK